MSGCYGNQS
jgi:hypothetical protein